MITHEALNQIMAICKDYGDPNLPEAINKILNRHANAWYQEGYKDAEMTYKSEWP